MSNDIERGFSDLTIRNDLCRAGGQLFPLCLCFSVSIHIMVLFMGQCSWERCVVCSVGGLFEDLKSGNYVCSALRRHWTRLFGDDATV